MKVRMRFRWALLLAALGFVFSGLLPSTSVALQGGPDVFGYRYADSNSVSGPKYVWEDLEKSGTEYKGFDKPELDYSNSMGTPIDIGFRFEFYGNTYSHVYLAANGHIAFSSKDYRNYVYDGRGLPAKSEPNNLIAPFWGWNDTFS